MSRTQLNIADFLARHVVTIVGMMVRRHSDGSLKGIETVVGSGFTMIYRRIVFLLTAGHIIQALDKELHAENSRLYVNVIDSLHYNAKHRNSLWLPYENLMRESVGNNDDIDYGFIIPDAITRACLEENSIIPVVPENWRNPPEEFDKYFLVGTPQELVEIDTTSVPPRVIKVTGAMIPVVATDDPPVRLIKPFPRFYGQIDLAPAEREVSIKSIGGMSGCPIIGMNHGKDGSRYWFYAIQSGWDDESVIAACPFKPFAEYLQERLDRVLDDKHTG